MKYGLKRNDATRKPNNVHEGKQLYVRKKRSWHDVRGQNLLETSNPTKIAIYLHEQQWKRFQTTWRHSEDAKTHEKI